VAEGRSRTSQNLENVFAGSDLVDRFTIVLDLRYGTMSSHNEMRYEIKNM